MSQGIFFTTIKLGIFGDLANSLAKRASGGEQGAGIARRSRIF